ncbi:MAG TPA: prephenate dehydratase [Myxococcota bacterium]|nr:prephenate dehydratase [Myxococcota bacterium]
MPQPSTSSPAAPDPGVDALERLRAAIDAIDRGLLAALNERARLVQEVGRIKQRSGTPVYEAARELRIVEALRRANPGPFPDAGLAPVFREIISATRSLEEPIDVAYFGPEGTFTHQAAREQFGAQARLVPVPTVRDVFAAVEGAKQPLGVVPVENTTEGVVTQTLDCLAEFDVTVCAEVMLRISQALLSRSGRLEDVVRVASHPQPLAQCRRWLERQLPRAERIETASTAAAAQRAVEDAGTAAVASITAAEVYGLAPIAQGIEDRRDNTTRFLVIGRDWPAASGNDLTSAVFTIRKDRPGGLHRLLAPFAEAGVNLTSIHLRPIPGKPWEYLFFVDLEGHRSESRVEAALEAAGAIASSSRVVGSFPRASAGREGGRP